MAVKQREARLIGNKVHDGSPIIRNYDRVFDDASRFRAIHFHQLELMAV
jgi:hypothetical protein